MAKYVFAYHGGAMAETEEEMAQVMAQWEAWYAELGESIVDGGNPFGQTRNVDSTGVTGPNDSPVSGYTVITAADIDAAVAAAKGCPILGAGGSVEVAEAIEM
jgi:hypothetical protein